jgi:hypothetical protein
MINSLSLKLYYLEFKIKLDNFCFKYDVLIK